MTEVLDATVVDEPGTGLAVQNAQPPAGLFNTSDPVEVVEKAVKVADALKDIIQSKQLFTMIQGKAHIGVEGWQLLGSMLGVTAICTSTEKVDDLTWKATVEARDQHGRVVGQADAICSGREKRGPWKNADDYARCSMAQTRATSKALKGPLGFVLSLAGYATTPAEEMSFAEPDVPAVSPPPVGTGARRSGTAVARPETDEDPWVTAVTASLTDLDLLKELRPKLKEAGVIPPSAAGLKTVLSRLEPGVRTVIDEWLGVERVKRDLGANEEQTADQQGEAA